MQSYFNTLIPFFAIKPIFLFSPFSLNIKVRQMDVMNTILINIKNATANRLNYDEQKMPYQDDETSVSVNH